MIPRENKWKAGLSVYLGTAEETKRRRDNLRAIAANLDLDTSKLIRLIADGKLLVCLPSVPLSGPQEHTEDVGTQ